ncbi:MAG: C69 family dipeptidase [Bacteroidales bacterium]|nr:C69 family dipeptidase [Bacteroidales bacterium]MDZ4204428.1 C69 family dipeptidase [Bacteroidales bacterium]
MSLGTARTAYACTNILITKAASVDGSTMISYSADSHVLYGELYHWDARTWPEGTMMDVYEWDTGKYLGKIKQARQTYNVVGNMNEHQLAIGETTYGGLNELGKQDVAIVDYGSLIYVTLQRAKNAREAIKIMSDLVDEYGYYSSGESFSISDPNEVWILEMIGKGQKEKGAVWVAMRIPDGYISGHANHARIQTFPLANGKNSISSKQLDKIMNPGIEVVYAHDVISFARSNGWFDKKDNEFSFSDIYNPVDFGGARFCEARVWSVFRKLNPDMDKHLDYAMGRNLKNRMPLWIKPNRKVSVADMMGFMRDTYAGTPLDMSKDIGAGPYAKPYRWRPLTFKVDDVQYCNERAIATQQTGFVFVTQSRSWLPDPIGGIHWFGLDDAGSTVFVPMYCSITEVPETFARGNGAMMVWSDNSAFWIFNQVSNYAYTRYNVIIEDIREIQKELEGKFIAYTPAIDKAALELYAVDKNLAVQFLTEYSAKQGEYTFERWKKLYQDLFMKYMDGNIKHADPGQQNPTVKFPGYGENWNRRIANETGDHLKVVK